MNINLRLLILDTGYSLHKAILDSPLSKKCKIFSQESDENLFDFIKVNRINVILIDMDLNTRESLSLLRELKEFDSLIHVILTGKPIDESQLMSLINLGATGYLEKPVDLENLEFTLSRIAEKRDLRKETFRLEKKLKKKYYFQGMIGKSPYMLEIFSLIENISQYFSTVLITGETGTGKELVAKALHNLSPFRSKDLVVCDSASIPENLVESELFGYMKGAFTGADTNKSGLFEEAHNGVIFLDEIGEIPLTTQAKLLRVLESSQFRPLGSNISKEVRVKVLVSTNRDIKDRVKSGRFREDLFHRLNKVEIHLPPLRERPEDIPLLVRHFLDQFGKKFNKTLKGVSRDVQKVFLQYGWPGNIRELENTLESAAMLCKKDFIDVSDLPKDIQKFSHSNRIPFINRGNLSTLDEMEKEYIAHVLGITKYNLRQTAKILNISRTTLYSKINKYNISH